MASFRCIPFNADKQCWVDEQTGQEYAEPRYRDPRTGLLYADPNDAAETAPAPDYFQQRAALLFQARDACRRLILTCYSETDQRNAALEAAGGDPAAVEAAAAMGRAISALRQRYSDLVASINALPDVQLAGYVIALDWD